MRRVLWLLCLGVAGFSWGSENPESVAVVQHAVDISNVRTTGTAPFRLQVQVRFYNEQRLPSQYLLAWVSPEQWREEINIGNARSVRVGGKHTVATIGDSEDAQMVRLQLRFLDFATQLGVNPNQSLGKVKNRVYDNVKQQCLQRSGKYGPKTELCFDTATGTLAAQLGTETVVFSDYFQFRGKLFPRKVTFLSGKEVSRTVEVQDLSYLATVDSSLFDVDHQYTTVAGCEHPVAPTPVALPDPEYPTPLRTTKPQVVKLSAVVSENGSVHNISVTRSAGALDAYAVGALSKWRFTPATCDGIPVPFTFFTDMNFRTY